MRGNPVACVLAGFAVLAVTALLPPSAAAFSELQQPAGIAAPEHGGAREAVPPYSFSGNGFTLSIRPTAPSSAASPEKEERPDQKPRPAPPADGFIERLLDRLFGDADSGD